MKNEYKGHAEAELDGVTHKYQYEIENFTDTNFDLTVWYKGQSIIERCPRYLANLHDDVRDHHGPMLLAEMLSKEWIPTRG